MIIVLAKLGSTEMLGRYSLGVAITTPILMFTNLDLRSLLVTDIHRHYRFQEYLGTRLLTAILSLCLTLCIALLADFHPETTGVIVLLGVANFINAIYDIIFGFLQTNDQMDRIAKSNILRGLLSLCLFSILLHIFGKLLIAVFGMVLASLIVLITFDTKSALRVITKHDGQHSPSFSKCLEMLCPVFHKQAIFQMVWIALPLGLVMGLLTVNANIPRYFAQHHLGESGVGIYSAMASIVLIGGTVVNSLMEAAMPQLARHYALQESKAFLLLLSRVSCIAALIGILEFSVTALIGKPLLSIVYRPEYANHMRVFLWLMASTIPLFIAYSFGNGMTASRHFAAQLPLFAIVTSCSLISCLLLVPRYGMEGLAMTACISASVQACGGLLINLMAVRRITDLSEEVKSSAYH